MYTVKEYWSGHKCWAVYRPDGALLCVCVYKRGANALVEHLNELTKGTQQ